MGINGLHHLCHDVCQDLGADVQELEGTHSRWLGRKTLKLMIGAREYDPSPPLIFAEELPPTQCSALLPSCLTVIWRFPA